MDYMGSLSVGFTSESVSTLLTRCLETIVKDIHFHIGSIGDVPASLKEKLLQLMSKRGLVTDNNISQVIHDSVKTLDLSHCDISDNALHETAARCKLLCKLDLNALKTSRTSISSQGISMLARRCPYLQVVYLRRCVNITDEAVITLSQNCHMLRDLNLGGCSQITDDSLRALGQNSPSLRSIDFSKTQVTDDGVCCLASGSCSTGLKGLSACDGVKKLAVAQLHHLWFFSIKFKVICFSQEIHMNGCSALTDEAVEAVVQFCPKLTIFLFHGCPNMTERSREALEELMSRNKKVKQVTWTVY